SREHGVPTVFPVTEPEETGCPKHTGTRTPDRSKLWIQGFFEVVESYLLALGIFCFSDLFVALRLRGCWRLAWWIVGLGDPTGASHTNEACYTLMKQIWEKTMLRSGAVRLYEDCVSVEKDTCGVSVFDREEQKNKASALYPVLRYLVLVLRNCIM
ncbi:hypothetical protein GOODEAATRI_010263, partial [Goodea atripinnis]